MTSLCITGLSDSAIEVVDQALQAAGVAPAQTAQRDSELSFASWHDRVYKSIEQGQGESSGDAGSLTELPAMGRLWEQLASDLFLSNIQTPLWSWSNAKSLGLLDYWLAFDAGIHFVLVATSPEQMLAENLAKLAVDNTDHKKSLAVMPVESLLAQWHKAHHAMLRFSLRHPERCILVLAEDLEQHELVSAAKAKWPKALNALRVPKMSTPSVVAELSLSPADQVLRHYATQLCEAYPQANSLHEEIASVATVAATQNTDKFAKDGVLHGVLATVALAHKVPLLLSQVTEVSTSRDSLLKDEAKLKNQLELEVSAKKQLQAQLTEQAKANAVLLEEKAVLLQEVQTRGQEAQANKSALEAEVTAKTQVMVALREEKALQKSVDEEKALLLTQLHQVQEELEKYYLQCKTLDKEIKSLIDSRPDFEKKAKAEATAVFTKERDSLIKENNVLQESKAKLIESNDSHVKAKIELQKKLDLESKKSAELAKENARSAQEKTKLIEARDALSLARSEVQEKLNKAGESRNLVVQEKIALSQKVKELIAAREVEIKRKTDLQAKLEEEIKAKNVLVSENTKLSQEKAKLIEVRESLVQARAEVQEKLNKAGQSRSEVVQEKIALSQKVKELITAREVEIKRKLELQGKLEEENKAKNVLASEITQLKQDKDKLIESRESLVQARTEVQEKLNKAVNARVEVVQEKIALSQKVKELIAAREVESKRKLELQGKLEEEIKRKLELQGKLEEEIKRKLEFQAKLEEESKAKNLLASEITQLKQENDKLIENRESLVQARTEVQEKLNEAGKSVTDLAQQNKALSQINQELTENKELETKAKAQALQQLEKEANLRADLETKLQTETQVRATLKQEIAVHVQEKATLGQEKTKLIAARDAESKAKAAALDNVAKAEARAKSAEDESAMMLAQLHKLQEDAERYDQRIKDLQANLNQATARFRRVTSRQPDGIDWESVQTQPLLIEGRPALQCRATNVAVMGKEWKSLEFVAFIQDGALAFNFVPSSDADVTGPLTRLPRGLGSIDQFTARAGKESAGQLGMELLKDLSTSDWDLLRGLPRMLSLGLQYVRGAWPSGMPGPTIWESAAKATLPALLRVPMSLRFDTFKLQGATAVPSYEQLRLRLDPLSLGKKRFAAFEFGFGCNLNQGRNFGTNARLEFFKGSGTSTFDQWVPNVRDGTVERLDLVFVFPTSMNLKDWSALSVSDRSLVLLLADQLPGMLEELVQGSVQIARPMSEWIALAEKLRAFVRTRLDVTGVQKQPNTLVDAVPGAVPQDAPSMPARRRASIAKSSVSDIKKQRAIGKTTVAAKKLAVSTSSARGSVRSEPARARKK